MSVRKILVADDDESIRKLYARVLRGEGYKVYLAKDGKEAVDTAEKNLPEVAILDIMMPVMDGLEAMRRIKELDNDIQVLINTGYGELESLKQALKDGGLDYLLKPTSVTALKDSIHKALQRRDLVAGKYVSEGDLKNRIDELERDFKERTYQLRESQLKYMEIVESIHDAIVIMQDGYTKFVNRVATEATGYTMQELLGAPFTDFIHPYDRVTVEGYYRKTLNGEEASPVYTAKVLRKDGSSFWAENHSARTSWEGRPAVLNVVRNVSERIEAQEALRESEEKYRGIFEQATDSILLMDLETGRLVDFNESAHKNLGYTREEFARLTIADIEALEAQEEAKRQRERLINDGEDICETKYRRKDGEVRDMQMRTRVISLNGKGLSLSIGRDVTETRRREEALRIKDAAVATSISGIGFADLQGNLTDVNESFLRSCGYENNSQVLGKPILDFFKNRNEGLEIINTVHDSGGWVGEITLKRKDGTFLDVQVSVSLVKDEGGEPISMMASFIDITEQKRTSSALVKTEKLSSLGQLAAGLAHELRNPLAVISSCSQFCMDNMKLERQVNENFQVIYRNAQRASNLINELLNFARPSKLEWEEVDINAITARMLNMAKLERKSFHIDFVPLLEKRLPRVRGDREKLGQVFLNLLQNAIQAISENGKIVLQTHYVESEGVVEINVIDDGPGIPGDYRHRIFDPFFTTKDGGTGLGLSISHSIIEQHNGSIAVEPGDDGGTRVSVRLPVHPEN